MTAIAEIAAPPGCVFDVLADISRHTEIDGSGTVQGQQAGPARLYLGAEFTMAMQQQLSRRYRSLNRVVEFEEGRRITWESHGVWRGHRVIGGQRWRWTLIPTPAGTAVQHTYLWGYARIPLLTVWLPGYPSRARRTLPHSLSRLTAILDRSVPATARQQRTVAATGTTTTHQHPTDGPKPKPSSKPPDVGHSGSPSLESTSRRDA